MIVKYAGEILEALKIRNFQRRSPIVDSPKSSEYVSLIVPVTDVNKNLFIEPFQDVEITIDDFIYYYQINTEPQFTNKEATLTLVPKLMNEMSVKLDTLYSAYNVSPIDIVTELFEDYDIAYDRYSFAMAKVFFETVKFEAGFSPDFMDSSLYDFVDSILNSICCQMVFDVAERKVYLHNHLRDYEKTSLFEIFSDDYISKDLKKSTGKTYYTGYEINIVTYDPTAGYALPQTVQSREKQYSYEADFGDYGILYVYQGSLNYGTTGIGDPVELLVAVYNSTLEVVIPDGVVGLFTGNRTVHMVGFDIDVSNRAKLSSQKYIKEVVWQDTKGSGNSGCIRQNSEAGAFFLGNRIIKKGYLKKQYIRFTYMSDVPIEVGDALIYKNKIYILNKKTKLANMISYSIEIERYVS